MPRQYVVPALPPPQTTAVPPASSPNLKQLPTNPPPHAVKGSQTTRGKYGTIKARVQGGGGGPVRPSGLRRESSTSGKANSGATSGGGAPRNRSPQKLQAQQQQVLRQQQQRLANASATSQPPSPAAGQPQRLVIDQSPTPLYCSEECRQADKNGFDVAAAAVMVKRSKSRSAMLPHALSDLDDHLSMRMRVGPHPSQINPATASPPPASPTFPPVPPNSVLGAGIDLWEMLPPPDKLARALSEVDTSSSSGSSDSGRSFATSNASEQDLPTGPTFLDPKLTDPPPPQVEPLPLHPHRPSAPVRKPSLTSRRCSSISSSGQESGLFMAARRFSSIFRSQESIVREKAEEDERQLRSLGAALFDPSPRAAWRTGPRPPHR